MYEQLEPSTVDGRRLTFAYSDFEALLLAMTNESAAHCSITHPELNDSVMSRNTVSLDLPVALLSSLPSSSSLRATLFFSSV
jgi:hypothetical protein